MTLFVVAMYAAIAVRGWQLAMAFSRRRQQRRELRSAVAEFEQTSWFLAADEARPRGYEVPPDHQILVWTRAEREALGINDTIRFIAETDKILEGD